MNDKHHHGHGHICGPECSHDYNHNHGQGHVCGPDCDHDHDHGHGQLFADDKERPSVYSFSYSIELDREVSGEELLSVLSAWIEELRDWAVQNNYLVGHIKTFTENEEGMNLWLACTGRSVIPKTSPGWETSRIKSFKVSLAEIIFGTDKHALEEKTLEIFNRKLPEHKKV
ncbi:MAG: hypothetical protein K6T65_05655 [Peptococcaceae bacterium]|nr:hypothetical protein [Peptococcaceae bacterium]